MGIDEVMKCVVEKLKEFLLALEMSGGEVLAWFDKVFLQETRGDKIHHWSFASASCCSCCCGCSGGMVKMMKAPRRNCRMRRDMFESDPKGYFGNLYAHPGDEIY